MQSTTPKQLQLKKTSLASEAIWVYSIYHHWIVCKISNEALREELTILSAEPIKIHITADGYWQIENKILIYYILFSYKLEKFLPLNLTIEKSEKSKFDFIVIFNELIAVIIRHKKSLPIKTIYNDVKKSLNKNACQTLFKKNTFSIVQYCSLLNISLATFKRAE